MASKMFRGDEFKTPECRVSYIQNLFKPRTNKRDDGTELQQYQCTLIFPMSAKPVLEAELKKAIVGQWGDKGLERARAGLIRSPFLAGDGKEARNKETGEVHPGLGPDVFFIRVSATAEVPPVVRYRDQHIAPTMGDGPDQIKSGDYGFAVLNTYCWTNPKNGDGVSFGIRYFQKTRPGENLGGSGSVDVSKYYEKIADEGPAPAATNGSGAAGLFG